MQVVRMATFLTFTENGDIRKTKRSWVQTLRPIMCSLETRKYSEGNLCQIREIKTNWEQAWFCFQTFRYIFYEQCRKYKTIVDHAPRQLVVLWHGDGTLYLSPKRKYFWKWFSQVGHRSTLTQYYITSGWLAQGFLGFVVFFFSSFGVGNWKL